MSGEQDPASKASALESSNTESSSVESPSAESAAGRRPGKSAAAFRTISEVAAELDIPTHVLRFWEGKFPSIKPLKRGGGRRYYRPEDVELLRRIRRLLYDEGYTIKGAQRVVREIGGREGATEPPADPPTSEVPAPESPASESTMPDYMAGEDEAMSSGETIDPAALRELERELTEILDELRVLRGLLSGTER